jgi:hypothetical protein
LRDRRRDPAGNDDRKDSRQLRRTVRGGPSQVARKHWGSTIHRMSRAAILCVVSMLVFQGCHSQACPDGSLGEGVGDLFGGGYCCGAPQTACTSQVTVCCGGCLDSGVCGCLNAGGGNDRCRSNEDCCTGHCVQDAGLAVCMPNAAFGACRDDSDCLSGVCDSGICGCAPRGERGICLNDSDCCFGGCRDAGTFLQCCGGNQDRCAVGQDCCSGVCDGPDGGAVCIGS